MLVHSGEEKNVRIISVWTNNTALIYIHYELRELKELDKFTMKEEIFITSFNSLYKNRGRQKSVRIWMTRTTTKINRADLTDILRTPHYTQQGEDLSYFQLPMGQLLKLVIFWVIKQAATDLKCLKSWRIYSLITVN